MSGGRADRCARAGVACFFALLLSWGAMACGAHGGGRASTSTEIATPAPIAAGKTAAATDPLAQGSGVALGVNLNHVTSQTLSAFTQLAGVRPKIVMSYQTWNDPLYYISEMQAIARTGAAPMISWDPTIEGRGIPLSEIADGRYDAYIKSAAEAARLWKGRIYIRFAHEMNLSGSLFGPGHPGDSTGTFVAAWRHVVSVFRDLGARNVEWVWSPNIDCAGRCPFTGFYPGNDWVDWVALDGYNYASIDNDPWTQFSQIFGLSYRVLSGLSDKPMMIGETASTEDGGSKARWITEVGHVLATEFTRVRAIVWFQRVKETDWRINSSSSSLQAFRMLVRSPPFSADGTSTASR